MSESSTFFGGRDYGALDENPLNIKARTRWEMKLRMSKLQFNLNFEERVMSFEKILQEVKAETSSAEIADASSINEHVTSMYSKDGLTNQPLVMQNHEQDGRLY